MRTHLGLLLFWMLLVNEAASFFLSHQHQAHQRGRGPCRRVPPLQAPQPYYRMSSSQDNNDSLTVKQEKAAAYDRNEGAFYACFVGWFTDFFRLETTPAKYKIILATVIPYSAASIWRALLFDDLDSIKEERRRFKGTEPAGGQSSSANKKNSMALADEDEQERRSWKDMELAESKKAEKRMEQNDDKGTLSKNKVKPGNEPELVLNGPFFNSDGWRTLYTHDPVPWSKPQQGLIRFIGGVEFSDDLSPRKDRNWLMEVCFKPESFRLEAYENPVFSQHGFISGWELRCKQGAVEIVFTTKENPDDYRANHNEKCIPSSVERGKWTHVLVFFDQSTSMLWCYVDGIGPVQKTVSGTFAPCRFWEPRLGQNPYWLDRTFHGEVAFARVDQQSSRTVGEDLTMYAATLAKRRLSDLEGSKGGEPEQTSENKNIVIVEDEKERRSKQDRELEKWDMALLETDTEKWRSVTLAEWDMTDGPPFDPDGWRTPGSDGTVPWSNSQQGLIKFMGAVEFSTDLSPQADRNWMMEVCFKPESFHFEDHKNPVFSQSDYLNGWELGCKQGAVELVFRTNIHGGYNESFIPASSVRKGQWTHVLVFFDFSTSTLWGYANGVGPFKKTVRGTFRPCPLNPRLGQNPRWPDRTFHGEIAFARVDQQSSITVGEELTTYAAALANTRLTGLEGTEVMMEFVR